MVAVPSDLATTVSPVMADVAPSIVTDTATLALSDDVASVTVTASPSASLNTPDSDTVRLSSASSPLMSSMAEATEGAAFTVTVKASSTDPPFPSDAVTVIVAVPRDFELTVRLE